MDLIQLHGEETPAFADQLRARTGRRVMKAIGVRAPPDLARAAEWEGAVDMVLFDAKPPDRPDALPGGNGIPFDWRILRDFTLPLPWMLSGGLTEANLGEAVALTGASRVDVSSGVESRPGLKDPELIRAFLARARSIEPPTRR